MNIKLRIKKRRQRMLKMKRKNFREYIFGDYKKFLRDLNCK